MPDAYACSRSLPPPPLSLLSHAFDRLILARVLEGKQCVGAPQMLEPPVIPGYEDTILRYDTTRDQHSSIVVTYRDQQVLPAYLISFKAKAPVRPAAASAGASASYGTFHLSLQALNQSIQAMQTSLGRANAPLNTSSGGGGAVMHAHGPGSATRKPAAAAQTPATAPRKQAAPRALPFGYHIGDRFRA